MAILFSRASQPMAQSNTGGLQAMLLRNFGSEHPPFPASTRQIAPAAVPISSCSVADSFSAASTVLTWSPPRPFGAIPRALSPCALLPGDSSSAAPQHRSFPGIPAYRPWSILRKARSARRRGRFPALRFSGRTKNEISAPFDNRMGPRTCRLRTYRTESSPFGVPTVKAPLMITPRLPTRRGRVKRIKFMRSIDLPEA